MKQTKLLFGFAIFLAAGISACSDDTPAPDTGEVAQKDEMLYMRVAILEPSGISSRVENTSTNFEDGIGTENDVKNLYFKFYDATGKPVNTQKVTTDLEFTDPASTLNPGAPSVGKVKEAIVSFPLNKGASYPAYVMCFINPVSFSALATESQVNMVDLRDSTRISYKAPDGSFAMNNSVYYGLDEVTGATKVKISGTPIKSTQIYTSEQAAKDATDAINIYVERYAAKVKFAIGKDAIQTTTVGSYTLTFTPEAWTINADANSMYAVKRFGKEQPVAGKTQPIPTFTEVDNMLSGWENWNDEALRRSYWACSPSYYASVFPQVSDQIADKVPSTTTTPSDDSKYGAGKLVGDYMLKYYSYNQICNPSSQSTGKGITTWTAEADGTLPCKYVLENTMGKDAFASLNPKAAAPSLLLVGNYQLTATTGTNAIAKDTKFYIYQSEIFFDNSVPTNAAGNAQTMLDKFLDSNMILAIDQNGTLLKSANAATNNLKGFFTVKHPDKTVRGDIAVPHRYVTLQFSETNLNDDTPLFYKPNGSDTWVRVTNVVKNQINTLLWQQLSNARAFTQGKAYFSIPIAHIGLTENTTDESPKDENGNIVWSKVRVGDFGLVRNHVYTLTVSQIKGLGTGIENLDYPIVPPMEADDYFIKYRINILNWRIVPEQKNIIL